MKQLKLLPALLMCLFAFSFAACSDGDDDDNGNNNDTTLFEKADLYGGWKYESGDEYSIYYFADDNSNGLFIENADSKNYTRREITYKVSSDITTLTIIDDGGNKENYSIFSLTDQKLVLEDSDEKSYILKRYTGNIDEEYPKKVISGTINGYEYVDLGLSVKWAYCNVGAESPEEYGDYFAWGETAPKSTYTNENSKTYGKKLGDISGNPEYDAATANWGGNWRMPTKAEMQELSTNCTWEWTTANGVNGYKVTSKKNGNSIFLPAAGCRDGSSLDDAGYYGRYWSSTSGESSTYNAYYLFFRNGLHSFDWGNRDHGRSVRPVSQ